MDFSLHHREREKCSLAVEGLRSVGELRLRASGVSMLPTLIPGDLLHIKSTTYEHVVPGDIVLYRRGDSLFAHRAIEVDSTASRLITRGDSMAGPDPEGSNILLGKVVAIERNGRPQSVSRRLGPIAKLAGTILCHSARLRNLFLLWQMNAASSAVVANRTLPASE
jgi:hypothetical protein